MLVKHANIMVYFANFVSLKFKLFITLLLVVSACLAQVETYLVSDLNFREFLQENHSEVLVNDSLLDIEACASVTWMDCSSQEISSLDGLQYFENLSHLNCSYNPLTELLNIPTNIAHLNCSYCVNIDTIGTLPNTLNYLNCSYNQIDELPDLPLSLEQLFCSVNTLTSIPYLPHNLTHIDCSFNNLVELPYLPNNLALINCSYNNLTSLPDLPHDLGLIYNNPLSIFNNNIQCVGEYTEIFEELLGIYSNCIDSTNLVTQDILLPEGWSIFSIYGLSADMNLEKILDPIVSNVIMAKDNYGSVYLTEWDYNGVGDITLGEAYQIKTYSETTLSLDLEYIQPESKPINMNAGWNMIGYLRNIPAPADLVLAELVETGNLLIAKDHSGAVYLPSWGFNGIGNMESGKGYQVKLQEDAQLHFLPNSVSY